MKTKVDFSDGKENLAASDDIDSADHDVLRAERVSLIELISAEYYQQHRKEKGEGKWKQEK